MSIYFKCYRLDRNPATQNWQGKDYTANTTVLMDGNKYLYIIDNKEGNLIKSVLYSGAEPNDVFIDDKNSPAIFFFKGKDSSGETLQDYINKICRGRITEPSSAIAGQRVVIGEERESRSITVSKNFSGSIDVQFTDGKEITLANCNITDNLEKTPKGQWFDITFDLDGKKYRSTFSAQTQIDESISFNLVFQGDVPVQIHGQNKIYSQVEIDKTAVATAISKNLSSDELFKKLATMNSGKFSALAESLKTKLKENNAKEPKKIDTYSRIIADIEAAEKEKKASEDLFKKLATMNSGKFSALAESLKTKLEENNAKEPKKIDTYSRIIADIEAADKAKNEKAEVEQISKGFDKVEADVKKMLGGRTNKELTDEINPIEENDKINPIDENDLKGLVAELNKFKKDLDALLARIEKLSSKENKELLKDKYVTMAIPVASFLEATTKRGLAIHAEQSQPAKPLPSAQPQQPPTEVGKQQKADFYGLVEIQADDPLEEDKNDIAKALQEWVDAVNKEFKTTWPVDYRTERMKMLDAKAKAYDRINTAIKKAEAETKAAKEREEADAAKKREEAAKAEAEKARKKAEADAQTAKEREEADAAKKREEAAKAEDDAKKAKAEADAETLKPVGPEEEPPLAAPAGVAPTTVAGATVSTAAGPHVPNDKIINEAGDQFYKTIANITEGEKLETARERLAGALEHLKTKITEEYRNNDEADWPLAMQQKIDNARVAMADKLRAIESTNTRIQAWVESTFTDEAIFKAISGVRGYEDNFIKITALEQNTDGGITLKIFIKSDRDNYEGDAILTGLREYIKKPTPLPLVPCNMDDVPDRFAQQRITKKGSFFVSLWLTDYLAQLRSYKTVISSRRTDLNTQEKQSISAAVTSAFGKEPAEVTWDSNSYTEIEPGSWEDLIRVLKLTFKAKLEEQKLDEDIIVDKSITNGSLLLMKKSSDKKIAVITLSPEEFKTFTTTLIDSILENNFKLQALVATLSDKDMDAENTGRATVTFYNAYKEKKIVPTAPPLRIKGIENIPAGYVKIYIIPAGVEVTK